MQTQVPSGHVRGALRMSQVLPLAQVELCEYKHPPLAKVHLHEWRVRVPATHAKIGDLCPVTSACKSDPAGMVLSRFLPLNTLIYQDPGSVPSL